DWKPDPGAKSALEMAGEAAAGMRMFLPIFRGGDWGSLAHLRPASLAEAKSLLAEAGEEYAAALEGAGPELERTVNIARGPLWGAHAVLFPVIDLLHHHGQVCYLQTLFGDREQHWNEAAINAAFGPGAGERPA